MRLCRARKGHLENYPGGVPPGYLLAEPPAPVSDADRFPAYHSRSSDRAPAHCLFCVIGRYPCIPRSSMLFSDTARNDSHEYFCIYTGCFQITFQLDRADHKCDCTGLSADGCPDLHPFSIKIASMSTATTIPVHTP